ncbi:MAG TPA: LacI family DNA-binding transcriptional regulator, partial [Actinopolymorphaceae bacterium]|nr:LacI family DNA-binding transcriptional regulator [Actinopolymorphaceae bacterium]
ESTRRRVLEAIDTLGYRPSELARSLRTQRTRTVALLIPDITNPFYPMLARGLQDAIKSGDYHSVVCNTDGDRAEELTFLDQMVARSVDGIVIVGFGTDEKHLRRVEDAGIPVVAFGPQFTLDAADLVGADDRVGMAEATRYLIGKGLRPIGFVGPSSDAGPGRVRRSGYEDALRQAGLPVDPSLVAGEDYTRESGAAAMRRLLEAPAVPRGVVCVNDLIAIGVLDVARAHGIAVPDDLAVVGFDDIEAASLTSPRLTTVVNPAYEEGRTAGQLMLSRLTGDYDGPHRKVILRCHLVVRESA